MHCTDPNDSLSLKSGESMRMSDIFIGVIRDYAIHTP